MSIAEKLTAIAENEQRVYEAGAENLFKTRFTKLDYEFFEDKNPLFQEYVFSHDISHITSMSAMFNNNTVITEFHMPDSVAPSVNLRMAFMQCTNLAKVSGLEKTRSVVMTQLFYGCTSLVDAGTLNFDGVGYATNTFANCTSLAEIRIVGTIPLSLSFQWSPLSVASMKSVIGALKNFTVDDPNNANTCTITFTDACWAALEADSTAPDGGTWNEYVTSLGWNT